MESFEVATSVEESDSEVQKIIPDSYVITSSGGFGSYTRTEITSLGWLRDWPGGVEPVISSHLSSVVHDSLLSFFQGLSFLPVEEEINCADGRVYTFERRSIYHSHVISRPFEVCGIDENDSLAVTFREGIRMMWLLIGQLHEQNDPWLGLSTQIEIGNQVGNIADSLHVDLLVSNPTSEERQIYFRNNGMVRIEAGGLNLKNDRWGGIWCENQNAPCEIRFESVPPLATVTLTERVPLSFFVKKNDNFPKSLSLEIRPNALEFYDPELTIELEIGN